MRKYDGMFEYVKKDSQKPVLSKNNSQERKKEERETEIGINQEKREVNDTEKERVREGKKERPKKKEKKNTHKREKEGRK